jgi:hypothetical protein
MVLYAEGSLLRNPAVSVGIDVLLNIAVALENGCFCNAVLRVRP